MITIDKGDGPLDLIFDVDGIVVKAPHGVWWMHGWRRRQVLEYAESHKWKVLEEAQP